MSEHFKLSDEKLDRLPFRDLSREVHLSLMILQRTNTWQLTYNTQTISFCACRSPQLWASAEADCGRTSLQMSSSW